MHACRSFCESAQACCEVDVVMVDAYPSITLSAIDVAITRAGDPPRPLAHHAVRGAKQADPFGSHQYANASTLTWRLRSAKLDTNRLSCLLSLTFGSPTTGKFALAPTALTPSFASSTPSSSPSAARLHRSPSPSLAISGALGKARPDNASPQRAWHHCWFRRRQQRALQCLQRRGRDPSATFSAILPTPSPD